MSGTLIVVAPAFDRHVEAREQEVELRAGGVLGAELHVVGVAGGEPRALRDRVQDLPLRHPEHVLHVDLRGRDEDVDPEPVGALQRLGGALDVAGHHASERRDHRALHAGRDLADGVELAVGGDREPGLEDVDVQPGELLGDLDLLVLRERDAGRLLPVAQGGVEEPDYVGVAVTTAAPCPRSQPRHHPPQLSSHVFELGRSRLAPLGEELREPAVGLGDPPLRERAVLDLGEDLPHRLARPVVDHARAGRVVAPLGGVGDRVAHPRQPALVDQVDDQLQLVQALEVRDLRLVAGLDERVEPGPDQLGQPAAQHPLLAEQVGLGLFLEPRLDDARAGRADPAPYASARWSALPVASCCTATRAGVPMPSSYVRRTRWPGPSARSSSRRRRPAA